MDDKNEIEEYTSHTAAKTILIIILIFGLIIGCIYLYLNSFIKRVTAMEMAKYPPESAVATIDTKGWNSVDKDTMNFIKERDATRETYETTVYYDDDEEAKKLLAEWDKEQARKRAEDIRSVLERDRENE